MADLSGQLSRRKSKRIRIYLKAAGRSVRIAWKLINGGDVLMFTSALAFSTLLTMVPLLLLSASAVGILLHSSEAAVQQLNALLNTMFPPQPFSASIKDSILQIVSDLIQYRASIGIVGVVVLMVTATFVFDIVRTILHKIYGLQRTRNLLVSFIHDVGFVLVAFVLLIATNLAVWTVSVVEKVLRDYPPVYEIFVPRFLEAVPTTIVFIVTAVMFYIVYGYITDTRPPRAAALVSTVTATLLWVASGKLFGLYLSRFTAIGTIYGHYAFLLVLFLWVYYSCLVFVLGGIVGQAYWESFRAITKDEITG